jgi:redox-sensitive bicupin YhaK (pirin superfamily)
VRRALPSTHRQMIGPFIFFDQMGPAEFLLGAGMDVRPHPHIGLSTVTYLFDGEIIHRDSLGTMLPIRAGELNWMTAGRGIAHSERTPPELRSLGSTLFGIQSWVALAARESPLDPEYEERAVYTVAGEVEIAGDVLGHAQLLVFRPGDRITIRAKTKARFMMLGGEPMDGPRHIWWNFVSSRKERIEQAKADWRMARFDPVVGDSEFIPLPESEAVSFAPSSPK